MGRGKISNLLRVTNEMKKGELLRDGFQHIDKISIGMIILEVNKLIGKLDGPKDIEIIEQYITRRNK